MDGFDVTSEEANLINEVYRIDPRSHDRRICICGHSVSRHSFNEITNRHRCKPGQLECPCMLLRPVIRVPNTRYFMRKSVGSGAKHALVRGVAASIEALGSEEFEAKREYLVPAECDSCKKPTKYYPVRITETGKPLKDSDIDKGIYAFLCETCRSL